MTGCSRVTYFGQFGGCMPPLEHFGGLGGEWVGVTTLIFS